MKTRIVNVCIAIALVAGGYALGRHDWPGVVLAQANDVAREDHYVEAAAPKGWGHVVGTDNGALVFEDGNGIIRIFDPGHKDQFGEVRPPALMKTITRK